MCSGRNRGLQYPVGKTDILSMTELIKSPPVLPLLGFKKFQRVGEWVEGRIMDVPCAEGRTTEVTGSGCCIICAPEWHRASVPVWAENVNLGRHSAGERSGAADTDKTGTKETTIMENSSI